MANGISNQVVYFKTLTALGTTTNGATAHVEFSSHLAELASLYFIASFPLNSRNLFDAKLKNQ